MLFGGQADIEADVLFYQIVLGCVVACAHVLECPRARLARERATLHGRCGCVGAVVDQTRRTLVPRRDLRQANVVKSTLMQRVIFAVVEPLTVVTAHVDGALRSLLLLEQSFANECACVAPHARIENGGAHLAAQL